MNEHSKEERRLPSNYGLRYHLRKGTGSTSTYGDPLFLDDGWDGDGGDGGGGGDGGDDGWGSGCGGCGGGDNGGGCGGG